MSTGNIQGGGQRRSVDPTQTGMPQSHTQVSQELMRLAAFGDKAGRLVLRGQGDGVHFERHRHIHRQIFITGTERASTNHRVEHLLHLSGRPDLAEAFRTHVKERGDKSVRSDFVAGLAQEAVGSFSTRNAEASRRLFDGRLQTVLRETLAEHIHDEGRLDALCRKDGLNVQSLEERINQKVKRGKELMADTEISEILDAEITKFADKKLALLNVVNEMPEDVDDTVRDRLRDFIFRDGSIDSPSIFKCAFGLTKDLSELTRTLDNANQSPDEMAEQLIRFQQISEARANAEINTSELEGADEITDFPYILCKLALHVSGESPSEFFKGLQKAETQQTLRDTYGAMSFLMWNGLNRKTRLLGSSLMNTIYALGTLATEKGGIESEVRDRIQDVRIENFSEIPSAVRTAATARAVDLERVADVNVFADLRDEFREFASTLRAIAESRNTGRQSDAILERLGYESPEEIHELAEAGHLEKKPGGLLGYMQSHAFLDNHGSLALNKYIREFEKNKSDSLPKLCEAMRTDLEKDKYLLALGLASDDCNFLFKDGRMNLQFKAEVDSVDKLLSKLQKTVCESLANNGYHEADLRLVDPNYMPPNQNAEDN